MLVDPTPTVSAVNNQTLCNGLATTPVTFSGAVSGTAFNWTNSISSVGLASSGADSIPSFTAINTASSPVVATITVSPVVNGCAGSSTTYHYVVNPTPVIDPVTNRSACNNTSLGPVNFSGTGGGAGFVSDPLSFTWTNNDTGVGLGASGTGNIGAFTATNSSSQIDTATIIVTPAAASCAGMPDTFVIVVYPSPSLSPISSQTLCSGFNTGAVTFTSSVAGTYFTWTSTDTAIGLGFSGYDSIGAFTAINHGTVAVIDTIVVSASANGCMGDAGRFTYTVNPTPTLDTIFSQTTCNSFATAPVHFNGVIEGTTYSWTNTNTAVGLPSTGYDSVGAFIGTNTSNAAQTATITVTPSANSCIGSSRNYMYTIEPTPDVISPLSQVLCNAQSTAPVNFIGSVPLTAFSWTNSDTTIGLPAAGSGVIPSFTAADTTTAAVIATITVTPSANTCIGASHIFTITVNPTPTVAPIESQILCNAMSSGAIAFTGTVPGTAYSWINTNTAMGLSATGIDSVGAFTAINATNVPVTDTVTVTPQANGCIGAAQHFTFTVNPTPTVDAVASQVFCNTTATNTLTFSGSVAGAGYSWTNSDTTIGLTTGGTDSIVSFVVTDTASLPKLATITIVPAANGCTGNSGSFTFTVNPTPTLSSSQADTICSGAPFHYTPAGPVTGTAYTWNRAAVAGLSNTASSGTGAITETLINTVLHPVTATYVYTLTANACSNTQSVILAVNPMAPTPVITINPPAGLCSQTLYQNFGAANAPIDTVQYAWTAANAMVFAEGSSHQFALVNFTESGSAVVTLTANVAGIACYSKDTFAVSVGTGIAQQPAVIYFNGEFACIPSDADTYQWGYDNLQLDSTLLTGEINQDYLNASPDWANKYYWVMTTKGGCSQKTYYKGPLDVQNVNDRPAGSVQLYPNPATDVVTMHYSGPAAGAITAEVYTLLGQKVATAQFVENKAVVSVAGLAAGNYVVTYLSNDVRIAASRLVKD